MMSRENVEIVKKFSPPAGTDLMYLFGDDATWAAAKEGVENLVAPDVEGAFIAWGQRVNFTGLDGMRATWLDWLAPWTSYYQEIEDVFGVGDDRVVVLGREHGRRRDTEAEVTAETAAIYLVRSIKIVRVDFYADRAEALETLGLSGQDAHADS
jgi:ketosteroid isomerase-like protein